MRRALVRAVAARDRAQWLRMRCALWPGDDADHEREIDRHLRGEVLYSPGVVLLAELDGHAVGFSEVSIRPYAEGCVTQRVGYLEGWWVDESARRTGVGAALVEAAQVWARTRGCTEFASDTEEDNAASTAAHLALGFRDEGLVRCFSKKLERILEDD